MAQFQVLKSNLMTHRVVESNDTGESTELADGEVRLSVERFSFTANNITYGVAGDRLGYWQFFPVLQSALDAPETSGEEKLEWGILPVWGFAKVIESRCNEVPEGERLFGYFPTAHTVIMKPEDISSLMWRDGVSHRAHLPPGYNQYRRVNNEANYDPRNDDHRALLFPLHITSFALWDQLNSEDFYGAEQIIIVSASSKTSSGLAYGLMNDEGGPSVVGLTSARHTELVKSMNAYTSVHDYDHIDQVDHKKKSVIVDMSGSRKVLGALHSKLQDNMIKTLNVGMTHWDNETHSSDMITERSEMFFAPSRIQQRLKDWGPAEFAKRSTNYMMLSAAKSSAWLTMAHRTGLAGLQDVYEDVAKGHSAPDQGIIIKP